MGIFDFSSIYGDHRHLRFVMRAHCVGTTDEEHFVVFITVHGWNRCSSFGNMHVFLLMQVWLENALLLLCTSGMEFPSTTSSYNY